MSPLIKFAKKIILLLLLTRSQLFWASDKKRIQDFNVKPSNSAALNKINLQKSIDWASLKGASLWLEPSEEPYHTNGSIILRNNVSLIAVHEPTSWVTKHSTKNQPVGSVFKITDQNNVFIGTGGHGHTFPHAMVPFDAVAWDPDWETQGWDAAGCNHYDAKNILGFSQVHLSDTGLIEGGKLLLMPTVGKIKVDPGTDENPDAGYRSRFSHTDKKATSGYFF